MDTENRKEPRIKTLKGGRIVYINGGVTRDCVIRNLSSGGAKLVTASTAGLPDKFSLMFEDGSQVECIVRRRKLSEIGVEFVNM